MRHAGNFHVSQNIDIDPVIAETFATWRQLWKECGHPGPMPRAFLTRHVHVAETDAQAKAEAAEHLATSRMADPLSAPPPKTRSRGPAAGMGRTACTLGKPVRQSALSCAGSSGSGPVLRFLDRQRPGAGRQS